MTDRKKKVNIDEYLLTTPSSNLTPMLPWDVILSPYSTLTHWVPYASVIIGNGLVSRQALETFRRQTGKRSYAKWIFITFRHDNDSRNAKPERRTLTHWLQSFNGQMANSVSLSRQSSHRKKNFAQITIQPARQCRSFMIVSKHYSRTAEYVQHWESQYAPFVWLHDMYSV